MTLVWKSGLTLQSPTANDPLLDLNTQPSLDLQFATSKTLDDRVSGLPLVDHQRDASGSNSPGTYVGSDGLIKTSPVNLLTYSEEFDNAAWSSFGFTWTPNSALAPDGSFTADNSGVIWNYIAFYDDTNATFLPGYPQPFPFTVTNEWVRQSTQVTTPAGCTSLRYYPARLGVGGGAVIFQTATVSPSTTYTASAYYKLDDDGTVLVWGAQLEEGSTATDYIPTTSTISGAPRFDHDPATGESLGLLIEEARTNLHSSQGNLTGIINPEGIAGDQYFLNWSAEAFAGRRARPQFSYSLSAGTYTLSFYTKLVGQIANPDFAVGNDMGPDTLDALRIQFVGLTGDLANDTHGGSIVTPKVIQELPNDWYRIQLTATYTGSGSGFFYWYPSGTNTVSLDTDTGFYVWGVQMELGSFPTSYIPTEGSSVTRAADVAEITGANFSSFYNQSEGTVFADFDLIGHGGPDTFIFGINAGNSTTGKGLQVNTSVTGDVKLYQSDNAGSRPVIGVLGGANTPSKATYAYSSSGIYGSLDGGAIAGRALNAGLPVEDTLYIGRLGALPSVYNQYGHIKRLTYYPYRLPDATLQEITS